MKKVDKAYIAGVIDSDGCIGSSKVTGRTCSGKSYRPYLVVLQRDPQIINWLNERFVGCVDVVKRKKTDGRILSYIRWTVVGKKLAVLLNQVIPYLVLKQEQAKTAVEMIEKGLSGSLQGRKKNMEKMHSIQFSCHNRIINLNSPATTERDRTQIGLCDSLNSRETVREESEAVLPSEK